MLDGKFLKPSPRAIVAIALLVPAWAVSPAVGQTTSDLYRITGGASDTATKYRPFQIPAGREEVLADLKGPGKVTYFYFTDDSDGRLDPGLVLEVFWDGAREPSIRVPLADFFGAMGGRTIDYGSRLMQINHLCYMCYLPMPFSRSARFVLANDGERDYRRRVAYAVDWEADPRYGDEPSRLHACWRRSNPTGGLHTLLETRGRGHYVGNFLQVHTTYRGWWGEGDTIFHRDGKAITHTPGTEDEYGSAWEFGGQTFAADYCGHIENKEGRNRMYRWYVANPVRFRESLKVEIQDQRYDRGQIPSDDDFVSVAFWYLDRVQPVTLDPYATRTAPSKARKYEK